MKTAISLFIILSLFGCSTTKEKKITQKKAELYYGHGTENLISKNYSEALEFLIKADELDPDNSKIINNMAMAYYFKKQNKTAIKLLKKAIKLDSKNSDAKNNLASIYVDLNMLPEARVLYEKVKEDLIYPHQYRTFYNLAVIAEKENRLNLMISYLEKSIKEREDYCPSHIKLGRFYLSQKKYSKAIKSFRAGSNGLCYKYPNSTYYLGYTWEQISENQKAVNKYMELISSFPKSEFTKMAKIRLQKLTKDDPILDLRLKKHNTPLKTELDSVDF